MRFTAPQAELAELLGWTAQALPRKPRTPALSAISLTVGEDITASATDEEVAHRGSLDSFDVLEPGAALVSGAFLRSIVAALRPGSVEVALDDTGRLTLKAGRSTYTTRVLLDQPPALPGLGAEAGSADAEDLRRLVASVRHPVDESTAWDQVAGLRLEADDDGLHVVGASRQVVEHVRVDWHGQPFAITVPLARLEAALTGMEGPVRLGEALGLCSLESEARTVTMRTYAADYLRWGPTLRPAEQDDAWLNTDAEELREALRRTGLVLSDPDAAVILEAEPEGLHVCAMDEATASAGEEWLDYEGSGEPFRVALRAGYLADALGSVPGVVRLGLARSLTVRGVDAPGWTAVVMPMRLAGERAA